MNNSTEHVFVRGEDGHLYQNINNNGATWTGWVDLGLYP